LSGPLCQPDAGVWLRLSRQGYNCLVRHRLWLGLIGIPVLFVESCGRGDGVKTDAGAWVEHRDAKGFSVRLPEKWRAEVGDGGLVVLRDPARGGQVLVQPFFLNHRTRALDWLAQAPARLGIPLPASRILRSAQVRKRPDEAAATASYASASGPGVASLLCSIAGNSGMLYAIAAPEGEFAALKPSLLRIVRSFRYTEATRPAPEFVTFSDPKEGAFTVDVPRGWTTTGGLYRFAATDTRPYLLVESPDGKIRITIGDGETPSFTVPNPMLTAAGFAVGRWYSPGYGVNLRVWPYMKGSDFAAAYVDRKFASKCGVVQIADRRDRPDLDARLGLASSHDGGMQGRLMTGEVAFICGEGATPRRGYYLAGTETGSAYGTGIWNVQYLYGYLADADAVELAGAVLARLVASSRVNPQWAAMQSNTGRQPLEVVFRTGDEVSRILEMDYWKRRRVQSSVSGQWSNMVLGLTKAVDPETGQTWKAASGHNYYWSRETSDATGYERPDTDFSLLKEW